MALTFGCEPSSSSNSIDDATEAVEAATNETRAAQPNLRPNPTKPLDLSRDGLDSLDQATSATINELGDPDNLLPDLFEDASSNTGARASGRVLMKEDEKASMQAIEGVEFKLEVPVN